MNKPPRPDIRTVTKIAAGAFAATLALTGCAESTHDYRAGLSPINRLGFDYVADFSGTKGGQRCLTYTPYKISSGSSDAAAARFDPTSKVLIVTPSHGSVLRLTGFDELDQSLAPADEVSAQILDTYLCDHPAIEEVPVQ